MVTREGLEPSTQRLRVAQGVSPRPEKTRVGGFSRLGPRRAQEDVGEDYELEFFAAAAITVVQSLPRASGSSPGCATSFAGACPTRATPRTSSRTSSTRWWKRTAS